MMSGGGVFKACLRDVWKRHVFKARLHDVWNRHAFKARLHDVRKSE